MDKAIVLAAGGGIGDALYTTPLLRALRERYAHTTVLLQPQHVEVISPAAADEVWADTGDVFALARRLRAGNFSAAVVTWPTARSAYALRMAGIPLRVGPTRRLYSPLFTHRVPLVSERGDRTTHWSEIQLNYVRALGLDGAPLPVVARDAAGDAQARALCAEYGIEAKGYAILHPSRGIAAQRASWPTGTMAELAQALRDQTGLPLFITGSERERDAATGIARRAKGIAVAGRLSIRGYAALAASARYVVAMDSGPMHIAAAIGVPTVGIFAMRPDEPDRWRPLGAATAVVRASYPCPRGHTKENCPNFACVRALDNARVCAVLAGLLVRQGEEISS